MKNNKPYAAGAYDEYCNTFASNLERFRLTKYEGEFDDGVIRSIEEYLPFRNEAIQLFTTIAQYSPTSEFVERTHRLFESLIPYMYKPSHITQRNEWDFDNFKFRVHELFLYALAVLLKHGRLIQAKYLLEQQYHIPGSSDYGRNVMVSYVVLREHMHSLKHRNKRLGLRRLSVRSDLLKERCNGTGIEFRYLMQADFVAFMRAEIEAENDARRWWPETLLNLGHFNGAFEVFARSVSRAYFNNAKGLLAIDSPKDLEPRLKSYRDGSRKLPRWEHEGFDPVVLLGYEQLATRA